MSCPRITVIVPAYHAAATLPAVLRALEPQVAGADREVIVVESSEGADAASLSRDWPWVRFLALERRALPGRARNLGAATARGEVFAFLDADAVPDRSWLDELERALSPDVELVAGAIVNGTPEDPWGTADYVLEFSEWSPERTSAIPHAASASMLIRRATFELAGGFPEDLLAGEDTVFSVPFALAGTLVFAREARVTHLNRCKPRAVLTHQFRLGAAWGLTCARVRLPGSALARRGLAPVAAVARLYAVLRRLRRYPGAAPGLAGYAGPLLAGLAAWGAGALRGPGTTAPGSS
ncbi:MAG: hypothetical protein QOH12_3511 [Solirubrobacteraceae bacterium]|jgi:GT2 family glycosyltransferase|nr:hypothetical protein [Solirubrobacteraceae bacterium]